MRIRFYFFYLAGIIIWTMFTLYVLEVTKTDNITSDELYEQFKPDLNEKNNPHDFNYLIRPDRTICSIDLVFIAVVCISPEKFEHRNLIRRTWANREFSSYMRAVFLAGLSQNKTINSMLLTESETYGDIVQEDFMDSYDNLTLKTIMGIKWVSTFCSNSKFVIKIDDDVVANTPALIKFLKNKIINGKYKNCYMGSLQQNAIILRNKSSKWFIEENEINGKYYPPYNQGPAYIFSTDIAQKLYKISLNIQFFRFEDIYVGVLANRLKVKFIALNKLYWYDPNNNFKYLSYYETQKLFVFIKKNISFEQTWNLLAKTRRDYFFILNSGNVFRFFD